jgi:hypothetical protein
MKGMRAAQRALARAVQRDAGGHHYYDALQVVIDVWDEAKKEAMATGQSMATIVRKLAFKRIWPDDRFIWREKPHQRFRQ